MAADAGSVIREYLLLDVVDRTASSVMVLNPGMWASEAEVPVYLYKSLCTLWTGASGDVVNYDRMIVAKSGEGKNLSENCIWISPYICDNSESSDEIPWLSDVQGGESARIFIGLSYKKGTKVTPELEDRTQNSELRIRLLLDQNLRSTCQKPQDLPIAPGGSINSSYGLFRMSWKGYDSDPSAIEIVAEYHAAYVREFARAVIP